MTDAISIEAKISNMNPDSIRHEQKQELFECIRHFMKYKSFQNIAEQFKVPDAADTITEALIALFESEYEGVNNEKPA